MDKETLSNYGWIVICVMVLAVMLAFASPFGNFVANAIKSTTQGLFDVNQGALDAAGIQIMEQEFDTMLNGNKTNSDIISPVANEHGLYYNKSYYATIDGDYFIGIIFRTDGTADLFEGGHSIPEICPDYMFPYTTNGGIITFDSSINMEVCDNGDIYCADFDGIELTFVPNDYAVVTEDYYYVFNQVLDAYLPLVHDTSKTSYGTILDSINNKPTVKLSQTFLSCTSMTNAPTLSSNLTTIGYQAFSNCHSLTGVTIPEKVTVIGYAAFFDCRNLTEITIPQNVDTIDTHAFGGCVKLSRINFGGSMEDWNAITFGSEWNNACNEIIVTCTDGIITIPVFSFT